MNVKLLELPYLKISLDSSIEHIHSGPRDPSNKGRGYYVGVPNKKKMIKILLLRNTNMAAITSSAYAL